MKSVKYLMMIVGLFCLGEIKAQVNLRLDSNSMAGIPNTVHLNSGYIDSVIIYNDSIQDVSGFISIGGNINGDTLVGDSSFQSVLYYPSANRMDTVPGRGHITRALIINVLNPPFIIGSSGVVIWPIISNQGALAVHISDSITRTVTVLYPLGVDELEERQLKVYMSGRQLLIENEGVYTLKSLKLYDVAGKLLLEKLITASGSVEMNEYAEGVYFAEINFADNIRAIVKVVNTR